MKEPKKMGSDLEMKVGKSEIISRLSDRNEINQTQSQCHPPNLPSHQSRQTQEHTIHQRHNEDGGTSDISQ
jgi:hypothetical protein